MRSVLKDVREHYWKQMELIHCVNDGRFTAHYQFYFADITGSLSYDQSVATLIHTQDELHINSLLLQAMRS